MPKLKLIADRGFVVRHTASPRPYFTYYYDGPISLGFYMRSRASTKIGAVEAAAHQMIKYTNLTKVDIWFHDAKLCAQIRRTPDGAIHVSIK